MTFSGAASMQVFACAFNSHEVYSVKGGGLAYRPFCCQTLRNYSFIREAAARERLDPFRL